MNIRQVSVTSEITFSKSQSEKLEWMTGDDFYEKISKPLKRTFNVNEVVKDTVWDETWDIQDVLSGTRKPGSYQTVLQIETTSLSAPMDEILNHLEKVLS